MLEQIETPDGYPTLLIGRVLMQMDDSYEVAVIDDMQLLQYVSAKAYVTLLIGRVQMQMGDSYKEL
jgi:hypothetical protein